jgi:hypothetical protein
MNTDEGPDNYQNEEPQMATDAHGWGISDLEWHGKKQMDTDGSVLRTQRNVKNQYPLMRSSSVR